MSNQFQYHLNWEKITSDTSCDGKMINRGIIFEDLVECLLPAMFPNEKWRRTQTSYDGKKDFAYPDSEALKEEKWAECKNYKSNLSINIIAPTLIMGVIQEIEHIFIFSRSPLDENAVEGLVSFGKRENKEIHLIDGNLLESLICKYHTIEKVQDLFSSTNFLTAEKNLEKLEIRVICILRDAHGSRLSALHEFCIGESFSIQVLIQNITCKPISLQIKETCSAKEKNSDLTLSAGQIYEYSIPYQIFAPKNISHLIEIHDKETGRFLWNRKIKLKVSDDNYLCWTGNQACIAKNNALNHLQAKNRTPLILTAGSGCGKSLLLQILLEDLQLRSSYRILQINLDIGRNDWAREFFAQLAGVYDSKETPSDQQEEEQKILTILLNNCTKSATEIAEKMISFYNEQCPYLLVIDDIQKINSAYLSFIIELEALAQQEKKPLYYLFALNTDQRSLSDLLTDLNWDEDFQKREYVQVNLCKFDKKDIVTFIQTQYGIQGIAEMFGDYQQKISPLEVSTFCKGLKMDGVIRKIPGQRIYQIVDQFKFQELVDKELYSGHVLETCLGSLTKRPGAKTVLKYIYLTGSLSKHIQRHYHRVVNELVANGILNSENEKCTFRHSQIRETIGENLDFSTEDYADIFDDFDTSKGAKALCVLKSPTPFADGAAFLKLFFSTPDLVDSPIQRYEICQSIFNEAKMLSNAGILDCAISFVAENYNNLNEESGYLKFQKLLCKITSWVTTESTALWDIDEDSVEHIAFFIKKFWDRTLSTHQQVQYIGYFTKIEQCFKNLKCISVERRAFWLCHYANRSAISLDRDSSPLVAEDPETTARYALSQDYCNQAGNPNDLRLQLIVDDFYRHYVYRHNLDRECLVQTERELCKLTELEAHECEIRDYHLLLIRYLQFKFTTSNLLGIEQFLTNLTILIDRCPTAFYQMKLYQLKIYVLCDLQKFTEAEEMLKTSLDLAYRKDMRTNIYRLTYISACLAAYQGADKKTIRAKEILALRQMLNVYGRSVPSLKREIFLLRQLMESMNQYAPKDLQELIDSQDEECKKMLQALKQNINRKKGSSAEQDLFYMRSYFLMDGIDFPTI